MQPYIDLTMHPERYHGHGKRPPFFEGWYYKMVSADESRRFAVIPGIFLSDDPARHHAFVQVFDGVSGHATYHRYPAENFYAAKDRFYVRVGPNHFDLDSVALDIRDEQRTISGELKFTGQVPYPVSVMSPGIMGPFGWLPFMECYHGIVSLDHGIEGAFTVDGQAVDFTGGRGYIEKDWGKSFPAGWVWMQTNHFEQPGTCLTASIAVTPLIGFWIPGFIVALWHEGALHRFATYTGARVEKLTVSEHEVMWVMRDAAKRLEISAQRADSSLLPGPNRVEMGKRVPETLKATIRVCLSSMKQDTVTGTLFEGEGRCAGLEVAGDLGQLLKAVNPKGGSTA
mgnify:CR=1 FL=1